MSKKQIHPISLLIQYNTGKRMAGAVQRIAQDWDVNHSEVCKRLAVLAALGFDVRHHSPIARLAEHVGDNQQKFIAAAHQAATLIDEHSVLLIKERRKTVEPTPREKFEILTKLAEYNEQQTTRLIPAGFEA